MGKPKKGTKNRQDEDFGDDDVDLDPLANTKNDEDAPVTKSKKGKKGKKKKDDDWEEDVAAEIKALSIADGENEDESAKQKKQKKPAVSAFAMLDIEEPDSEEDSADEEINKPPPKNQPKPKGSENNDVNELEKAATKNAKQKKGKKDKNRQQEADEDLDALLAEIEKPVEKTQGKKKKKKKGGAQEDEENALNAEEGGETVEDASAEVEEKMEEIKAMTAEDLYPDSDEDKKKKKKKGKKQKEESNVEEEDDGEKVEGGDDEDEGPTVKTAAQKKKEKKEREKKAKQEKAAKKAKGGSKDDVEKPAESKEGSAEPAATTEPSKEDSVEPDAAKAKEGEDEGSDEEDGEKKSKKDKKKKKKDKAEKGEKKKKPANAQIKAMQEALQKMKEEEERLEREEDERIKREEEAERLREEKKKLDEERREKKKQKEKERKERLKKEGKLLTDKQKQDMKRAQQMLEMMEAQGIKVPQREQTGEKKRVVYGRQRKKKSDSDVQESTPTPEVERSPSVEVKTPTEEEPAQEKEPAASWDADEEEVKDDWDKSDDEAPEDGKTAESKAEEVVTSEKVEEDEEEEDEDEEEEDEESDEESDEDSEEDSDEESESDDDEDLTPAERAGLNIMKRKEAAEKKRDINVLRSPVVCVLGHVDTGKTKILDKLRRTNVQDGEAGGITQQIGATNVPLEAIKTQTRMCKDFLKFDLKLPGLLIIDTPGHESFSNLRSRGSSLCDIAILVIDIMHGLEPQTIESIELLKSRKTPFIVALNKVDRLFGWKPNPHQDVKLVINKQQPNTKLEFEERTKEVIVQLSEQGLNSALYYNNKNVREYVSLVPTSAHSGDGMGSLVALICELTQTLLAKRISFVETLEATVMEVKALPGLGTTVDVILVNGVLREGDTIILPGTEGPISTQVRGLLMPQPMKELRVKNAYEKHKEVHAAQGVKLIAKDMEKALAGLPMYVAHNQDEVEYYKEELSQSLKDVLNSIKLTPSGVYVQASTLGSLEALLEFLRTSKIPYSGINIGPVHKKDVMKASVMLEHDSQYACILAFDVKVEREAQEMAENLGVKVFTAEIIYHLFDQFTKYQEDLRLKKKEEFKHIAVFPCKLRVLPNCIFNTRDPIILGVSVEAGCIKEGSPLCVPSKEFVEIGRISSLEVNHKQVDVARKGMEVCIKIENTSGDAPKLYGRHFDHTDLLVSKISRESIDALKDYFRDEMTKADWALVVDLKKKFEIM